MVLFWCCLARSALVLSIRLDASVWVKATDYTIGFLQDLAALLKERLDSVHKLLLIKFLFRLALS
jgi:hypothetical protein